MSGLISNLATSSKALGVHSKGLEIAGKNLANINNRNYAKQRVEIGDRGSINRDIATESMGVEAMELRQNRDVLLDKSVMRELTASSGLEAAKKILESAEGALGQFLDRTKDSTSIQNANGSNGGGISDSLSDFFNAWESYSVKPNDVAVKQLLIEKAKILADKINVTDDRLEDVQSNVDGQIASDLIDANGILKVLARDTNTGSEKVVEMASAVDVSDEAVEKMLEDSLEHAFEDMNARIYTEARLKAEEMLPSVEKALALVGDRLSAENIQAIRSAMEDVRVAMHSNAAQQLKKAAAVLDDCTQVLATLLVESAMDAVSQNAGGVGQ